MSDVYKKHTGDFAESPGDLAESPESPRCCLAESPGDLAESPGDWLIAVARGNNCAHDTMMMIIMFAGLAEGRM